MSTLVVAAAVWILAAPPLAFLIGHSVALADARSEVEMLHAQIERLHDCIADEDEDAALLRDWLAGPGARPTRVDRERWNRLATDTPWRLR